MEIGKKNGNTKLNCILSNWVLVHT